MSVEITSWDIEAVKRFLRVKRAEKCVTQAEAAKAVGVHWRTWSQWESDGTKPTFVNMVAIAQWAGITVDELAQLTGGGCCGV